MAFINPLDKYRLSSSPPQPPRPPSTSTRSARPAAYPRSLSPSLSLSLSPASWEHHHPKAATTTPVQRQQRQRRARRGSESVSPSRRRVTRSQSRELEAGRGDEAEQLAAAARRGKARAEQSRELAALVEESPNAINQPHAQRDTIPQSPEEHNISGTTILPVESEPDTGDLDPLMMIEALPDLQRAASAVLEFCAPNLTSPASIIELARRLQDPKSTQSRRLERLRSNFSTETKYFGNQTYIEVEQVARALPSVEIPPAPGSSQARSWHADGILFKSNCARLALEVLTRPSFSGAVESAIYDLEGKFPSPFLNALVRESEINTAGKSSLRRATFDLALEIRTQFLKVKLETHKNDDNFNPNALLHHAFFNEILETQADVDEPPLRGFNLSTFQDEDGNLPLRYEEDVLDRVSDIRKFFKDDVVDFEGLEATFPWEGFLYTVGKWIRMRDEEVNRQLSRQPAAEDMRDRLEEAVNSSLDRVDAAREKAKAVDSTTVQATVEAPLEPANPPRRELLPPAEIRETRRASSRSSFLNPAAIRHLFEREERLKSARTPERRTRRSDFAGFISRHAAGEPSASAAGRTRSASEAPRMHAREREIPASPEADVFADPDQTIVADSQWEDAEARRPDATVPERREPEAPLPGPSSEEILAVIQRHKAATKGKGRHLFIDRQENATRVSPISEVSQVPETANRKRKRVQAQEDESEEEAFTQDDRRVDVERKRAQKPQQKRPRLEDTETEDEEPGEQLRSELASSAAPTPHRQDAHMTGGAAARVSSPTPATVQIAVPAPVPQTRPSAVSNVAMPQSRRRWSLEENERLIYLVGKYGTAWAQIKRADELWPEEDGGPRLTIREQGHLKDRARNIVIEYYRSGQPLPKNFEQVTIKKSDRDKLRSMGIEIPERKELSTVENRRQGRHSR